MSAPSGAMTGSSSASRPASSKAGAADDKDAEATTTVAVRQPSGAADVAKTSSSGQQPGAADVAVPINNYAFFAKYTYSNECALLAYNFHEIVIKVGIFDHLAYRHDHRLISVTLVYIFYKYQIHHCDMALDLAMTLIYLEDLKASNRFDFENNDALNVICYFAFLAHVFNADRTIRLHDWYKEIGWRSFKSCRQLNGFVFFLFAKVRKFRLKAPEVRVKRYIQRLCSVPHHIRDGAA